MYNNKFLETVFLIQSIWISVKKVTFIGRALSLIKNFRTVLIKQVKVATSRLLPRPLLVTTVSLTDLRIDISIRTVDKHKGLKLISLHI